MTARTSGTACGAVLQRFQRNLVSDPATGCLNWTGEIVHNGYGRLFVGLAAGRRKIRARAHRFAYELAKGPIPEGFEIDHLCRNRRCCNPEHLEAVTPRENTLRGESFAAKQARQTHCKLGHEFVPAAPNQRAKRVCRICALAGKREYHRRARIARREALGKETPK